MHASPATPAASLTRARAPRAFRAPTSPAAALRPSWTASSARGIRTRVAARAACPSSSVAARGLTQRHVLAAAPGTRAAAVALPGDAAARSPLLRQNPRRRARVASRAGPVRVRALVNVDLGPSAILGASVMLSAIGLYQVRASRPEVSRDQDVFFSSVGLLTGGILVFQGWRLDPLMLFGQLLTAATAVSFASEAIGLRQEVLDREARMEQTERDRGYAARRDPRGRGRGGGGGGGGRGGGGGGAPDARRTRPAPLPPPSARAAPFDQWREQPRGQFRDRDQPRGRAWNQDEYAFDASVDAPRGGVEAESKAASAPALSPAPARTVGSWTVSTMPWARGNRARVRVRVIGGGVAGRRRGIRADRSGGAIRPIGRRRRARTTPISDPGDSGTTRTIGSCETNDEVSRG